MLGNSFRVCGITTNDPSKVKNYEFLKKITNSQMKKEELFEDEDPFSCV